MKRLLEVFATLAFGLVFSSASNAIAIRCDACYPPAAKQQAISAGPGIHYVYSVSNGIVRGYDVAWSPDLAAYWATDVAVPADLEAAVIGLQEIYVESGGTMKVYRTVDSNEIGISDSAFDIARNANRRYQMGSALATQPPSVTEFIAQVASAAAAYLGFYDGSVVEYIVQFPDGTTATYSLRLGSSSATYVEGSARDANGNVIPEANSPQWAGTYNGGDLSPMLNYLDLLGVRWQHEGSGAIVGSIECSWQSNTLECRVRWRYH
jgi:hypothetical protein